MPYSAPIRNKSGSLKLSVSEIHSKRQSGNHDLSTADVTPPNKLPIAIFKPIWSDVGDNAETGPSYFTLNCPLVTALGRPDAGVGVAGRTHRLLARF